MIDVVNKFNMVDMGGIDIVESQGVAVDGLFSRLLTAIQNCRYQILYNWKFAEIEIVPSPVELVFDGEKVSINEAITVTEDDVVHIYSLEPEPIVPVIESLTITENGVYEAQEGVDGFNPVTVNAETFVRMTQDEWDSLSIEEKKEEGLVVIGDEATPQGVYYVGNLLVLEATFDHENGDIEENLTATPATHGYSIATDIFTGNSRTYEFVMTMVTGRGYGIHMLSFGGSGSAGGSIYFDRTTFGWYAGSNRFSVGLTTNIQNGERFHAAVVVASTAEGMHFSLYFNGDLVGEKTVTNYSNSLPYSSDNFAILFDQSQGADFYNGTFYKFAVSSAALEPSDFILRGE